MSLISLLMQHPVASVVIFRRSRHRSFIPGIYCYDMFYQKGKTPFLAWCEQRGSKRNADGLGMLVAQAAHAFLLWHGVLPDVEPVIKQLQEELSA